MSEQRKRERRWRLLLGREALPDEEPAAPGAGGGDPLVRALDALYGGDEGGMGDAAPELAQLLEDVRDYFPRSVVRILQQDALARLNVRQLLRDPELLAAIEPDVELVARILSLNRLLPARTRATAEQVVTRVVLELVARLEPQMRQALRGALHRPVRTRRPRLREINWQRTVMRNLKHYQPDYRTVVPDELVGYGQKRSALQDVILCVDQSGSMRTSVVYAGIFAAVLASLPAVRTRLVAFSTSVVDLTDQLHDPVGLLFGTQLRGGTDIVRALTFCRSLIVQPEETVLVLISDLFDGRDPAGSARELREIAATGATVIVLLTLSDDGAPRYNADLADELAVSGIPCFACTPDRFPDLMAAALAGRDLAGFDAGM